MLSRFEVTQQYSDAGKGVGCLFVLFFSVEKASQKVMEQKGMILGNPGTEGEADPGLTLAWGRPGITPGRGEPKGPSPPCDFKWGH